MEFDIQSQLAAVKAQFGSFLKPDQLRTAMRTTAKRVARHRGQISKYDGQGRRREGFPAAGDTGSRPFYPYPLATLDIQREELLTRRRNNNRPKTGRAEFKRLFDQARAARGPSRKGFVNRTDGGHGDWHD